MPRVTASVGVIVRRLFRGIGRILSGWASRDDGAPEADTGTVDPEHVIDPDAAIEGGGSPNCPHCGAAGAERRETCPRCGSADVAPRPVFEHFACGCTRLQSAFEADGGFVCPKCRTALRGVGVDFARVGVLYRCGACSVVVDRPERRLVCGSCALGGTDPAGVRGRPVTLEFGESGGRDRSGERVS